MTPRFTLHIAELPAASVAVYVTSVMPGGSSATVDATVGASSHASVAIAPGADTVSSSLARTKISGAGHSSWGAAVSTTVTSVVQVWPMPSPDSVNSTIVVPSSEGIRGLAFDRPVLAGRLRRGHGGRRRGPLALGLDGRGALQLERGVAAGHARRCGLVGLGARRVGLRVAVAVGRARVVAAA